MGIMMRNSILNDVNKKQIPSGEALRELYKLKVQLALSEDEYMSVKENKERIKKEQNRVHKLIKRKNFKMKEFDYSMDEELTAKEFDILELLKGGYNYQECADILNVTYSTLRTHVNNLFLKLHVNSLQELLVKEFNRNVEIKKKNETNQQKLNNALKIFKKRW